jgi:hypothetical protein
LAILGLNFELVELLLRHQVFEVAYEKLLCTLEFVNEWLGHLSWGTSVAVVAIKKQRVIGVDELVVLQAPLSFFKDKVGLAILTDGVYARFRLAEFIDLFVLD